MINYPEVYGNDFDAVIFELCGESAEYCDKVLRQYFALQDKSLAYELLHTSMDRVEQLQCRADFSIFLGLLDKEYGNALCIGEYGGVWLKYDVNVTVKAYYVDDVTMRGRVTLQINGSRYENRDIDVVYAVETMLHILGCNGFVNSVSSNMLGALAWYFLNAQGEEKSVMKHGANWLLRCLDKAERKAAKMCA